MRELSFTEFSHHTATLGKVLTQSWGAWIDRFSQIKVTGVPSDGAGAGKESKEKIDAGKSRQTLFTPGIIPDGMSRDIKHVTRIDAFTLDLDSRSDEEIVHLLTRLSKYEYYMWTTHKHGSDLAEGKPRLRLIFPLSKPIEIPEGSKTQKKKFWAPIWNQWNYFTMRYGDQKTKDLTRMLYYCSTFDFDVAQTMHNSGEWITLEEIMDAERINKPAEIPAERYEISEDGLDFSERDALRAAISILKKSKDSSFEKLLTGDSFIVEGDSGSHDAMMHITWGLAKACPNLTESVVEVLFQKSMEIIDSEAKTPEGVEGIWRMYEGALEKIKENRHDDQLQNAGFSDAYSPDTLVNIAKAQNCSVEDLINRWIIQKDTSTWYLDAKGSYVGPYSKDERELVMHRHLARIPNLSLYTYSEKGGRKEKTFVQLFRIYGSVALRVVADMTKQVSSFDPKNEILYEAVTPLRDIEVEYSPEINRWLELLGGVHHGKLLDWMSVCMDLDKPLCVIYFAGVPGSGKSLFAQGLAKIFTEGPAGDMTKALGKFNDEAVRCPILLADEQLRGEWGRNVTGDIRKLVANPADTLEMKYQSKKELRGFRRAILAANNSSLLGTREDLCRWDMEAVAQKVLYVEAPREATEFLEAQSTKVVNAWGMMGIAKHALWLRENHKIANPGKRFLVEGDVTKVTRLLLSSTETPSLVCQMLCTILTRTVPIDNDNIIIKDKQLLVRAPGILEVWSQLMSHWQAPEAGKIGRALASLSLDRRAVRYHNKVIQYRIIDMENVIAWAESADFSDRDTLLEALETDTDEMRFPSPVTLIRPDVGVRGDGQVDY